MSRINSTFSVTFSSFNKLSSVKGGWPEKKGKDIKLTNRCQDLTLNMPTPCVSYSLYMKFIPQDCDLDVD